MPAAATDLFQEVGINTATTLDAPGYTISDTSVTVASTANIPTSTGITFAMDEVDANGDQVAGSYNEYVGVVASATSITSVSHQNGTDRNYSAGTTTRVYLPVSAERENRLVEGILVHADQDGTLKAGAVDVAAVLASDVVTTAKILNANVTTAKIADANVTAAKLSTSAILLGYAEITSDFTTTATPTITDVTSLEVAVTVPAGGRRVRVTAFAKSFRTTNATAATGIFGYIRESTTTLSVTEATSGGANFQHPFSLSYSTVASAGAHTYKVSISQTAAGTLGLFADATYPAYIMVELL